MSYTSFGSTPRLHGHGHGQTARAPTLTFPHLASRFDPRLSRYLPTASITVTRSQLDGGHEFLGTIVMSIFGYQSASCLSGSIVSSNPGPRQLTVPLLEFILALRRPSGADPPSNQ